jgi:Predicted integral membrane protein (DUF2269)
MIAAEVQFYDVVVFFHTLAVVLAFGPTFAYGLFFATAGRTNPAALPTIGRVVVTWSQIATRLGILVILISGLYLTDDRWDFGDFFASWGIIATLILFGMTQFHFIPTTQRFVDAAEAGREDEVAALAGAQQRTGPIAGIIVILTIYVMTAKPFL